MPSVSPLRQQNLALAMGFAMKSSKSSPHVGAIRADVKPAGKVFGSATHGPRVVCKSLTPAVIAAALISCGSGVPSARYVIAASLSARGSGVPGVCKI
eukprot:scaffold221251_cov32-Tisochrysis_lutea.AAC.3